MKLPKRAETALRGSIRKWEAIVAGDGEDRGPNNCPLCELYFYTHGCGACPVARAVNASGCDNTPYSDWFTASNYQEYSSINAAPEAMRPAMRATAEVELAFLRSLLPDAQP